MNAIVQHQPMTNDQVGLIKRMIAKDATDDELSLFLQQCNRTGLDPFSKQIYAISRYSKAIGRKVMSIQVSIDGARLTAQRTGRYAGQDGPFWCGEDGIWKDVWLTKDKPRAAKVLVYLLGVERGTPGVAHWTEYGDDDNPFWKKMPALMLAKCAEMLALRKAFPQELSGLYSAEEMAQADNVIDVTHRIVNQDTGEIADNPFEDVSFEKPEPPWTPPTEEEKAILSMWMGTADAYTWAVNSGACKNGFEAENSMKKVAAQNNMRFTAVNKDAIFLATLRHWNEKIAQLEQVPA